MARRRVPTCIEEGCKRKVRPRENWHTMSEEYALMASEYHHRCNLCYVRWLCVTGGSKLTRANKEYSCEGCERLIQKGEHYNLAFRKAFLHARYPERVHICTDCVSQVPTTAPATQHSASE